MWLRACCFSLLVSQAALAGEPCQAPTSIKPPAAQPQAMASLHTEGKIYGPLQRRVVKARHDFPYMLALANQWQLSQNPQQLATLSHYFDAWVSHYQLSFNPIDESHFDDFLSAFAISRQGLPADIRQQTAHFIRNMVEGYLGLMQAHQLDKHNEWHNNWQSHRIKLVTLGAVALNDKKLLALAHQAFRQQLAKNIQPGGEVWDFQYRDALHYVVYDIEPLLRAALAANTQGQDWFREQGPQGQSLKQAVDWLTPYAKGEKQHQEFVHTKVAFDKKRQQAGVKGFFGLWQPDRAANVYWAASIFDSSYLPLAKKLRVKAPSWLLCYCH
ncbi:alginate lyase family protein [Gallaecimonas mangrovi]|uniref:alginate lyase family protein n=1 Tax=Gallaecimonas mangrovi TaxID=2291597 RepID=UPI000E20774B|nr:alginate lyase family protein [Gallaecimonas mangrovi]